MNVTENLEIERKFLIEYPNIKVLDIRRCVCILQTYLINGNNGSQRRVRRITENETEKYTYTEKVFRSASVREENEFEITIDVYNDLLNQAKSEYKPVEKIRYLFDYMGQLFELDCYSFSSKFAILELELRSEKQKIVFPDNISIINDVTSNHEYSNAALATAGSFPEERRNIQLKEEC